MSIPNFKRIFFFWFIQESFSMSSIKTLSIKKGYNRNQLQQGSIIQKVVEKKLFSGKQSIGIGRMKMKNGYDMVSKNEKCHLQTSLPFVSFIFFFSFLPPYLSSFLSLSSPPFHFFISLSLSLCLSISFSFFLLSFTQCLVWGKNLCL